MLFRLQRDGDCSASGVLAVNEVTSCPALVRKLVFDFYERVKASQNRTVLAICGSDIWCCDIWIFNYFIITLH